MNEEDNYQIRIFKRVEDNTSVTVSAGEKLPETEKIFFELDDIITDIKMYGEPLRFIPAWPLNGSIDIVPPVLTPIIDKELALYNKVSRRNHLLYGASTYTPIIISDMGDEEFDDIVQAGLGSWLHLRQGDDAKVLDTPTAALTDMDRAIANSIEEMAKLGIRMLTPETDQSGIALQIRNAAQTAQLGSLNQKISNTIKQIIAFLINWRFNSQILASDIEFSLSADFNPTPLGEDWLRLATEWYQQGLIPRSTWLNLLKHNDIIPPDYDDEEGQMEIAEGLEQAMAFQSKLNESYGEEMIDESSNMEDTNA